MFVVNKEIPHHKYEICSSREWNCCRVAVGLRRNFDLGLSILGVLSSIQISFPFEMRNYLRVSWSLDQVLFLSHLAFYFSYFKRKWRDGELLGVGSSCDYRYRGADIV